MDYKNYFVKEDDFDYNEWKEYYVYRCDGGYMIWTFQPSACEIEGMEEVTCDEKTKCDEKIFDESLGKYFIVVDEWNYPTESGRDVQGDYDTFEEAISKCKELAENEEENFEENCGMDCLDAAEYEDGGKVKGYIITTQMGLDDFYYATRIIEVNRIG